MPRLTMTASVNDVLTGTWMGTVAEYDDGSFYRAYDQTDSFIGRYDNLLDAKAAVERAYLAPPPAARQHC